MVVAALQPWAISERLRRCLQNSNLGNNESENKKNPLNPEGVWQLANPFRVSPMFTSLFLWLSLRSNHGLQLANAFGVVYEIQT